MTAEIGPDSFVGVNPEKLSDKFHGNDLTVAQRRFKATTPQVKPRGKIAEPIIYQAEHGDDKIFNGQHSLLLLQIEHKDYA
jgi:hypothetical protein